MDSEEDDSDIVTENLKEKKIKDKFEKIDNANSINPVVLTNHIIDLNSLILKDNQEYNKTLKSWINPNKNIKSKILYRMTRDGIRFNTFHTLCDNKGPTLTLIKIIEGDIIGMYTPLSWETKKKEKKDPNIFVFSLTKNLKSMENMNEGGSGMYCAYDQGPCSEFLGFQNNNGMNIVIIYPYNGTFIETPKFGLKEKTYRNTEVEVFELIIE